ncbi:MAG: spermidine synthase [Propionibacteriaceae bacterium]
MLADAAYPAAWLLRVGGTDQSYVDLEDPLRLDFDYVQRLADAVDALAEPGTRIRIVHIGGALMTLPRYVAATRPHSAQIVLEPDAELTGFVRQHVPLPRQSGIKVRDVDGRTGITAFKDDYADVVVLDAFDGAQVPAELTTVEFVTEVARVLAPGGTLLVNLTDKGPFDYARRVVASLTAVFPEVVLSAEPATLKGRRFGNVVLLGSASPLPVDELTRTAAASVFPYRILSRIQLTRFQSGATPFTDDDARTSPPPPAGRTHFG